MSSIDSTPSVPDEVAIRERCYGCYRPTSLCFCDQIPSIENRTDVLILQHMRERFHPFNTARIVRRALRRSRLLVDHNLQLATRLDRESLSPRVGLLYPGPGGRLLSEMAPNDRPDQLVIIDGTWHHARALLRDVPRLNELPRYQIIPPEPGRYRIRREPNAIALSTLEATVAALTALEPETLGFDRLVHAFNVMVETQLAHPKADYGWRKNQKRSCNPMGIPRVIRNDLANVVVAYGESEPGKAGCKRSPRGRDKRQPVYWVAQRLGSGEQFRCLIEPRVVLPESFLNHVGLPAEAWNDAKSVDDFRQAWSSFLKPTDTVALYHQSTMRLLSNVDATPPQGVILKSIKFNQSGLYRTLDRYLDAQNILTDTPAHPGRAGQRLANAIAMVRHLNTL